MTWRRQQWARVKELFHAALEREEPERSLFLDDACRDDLTLRAEIDRLLLANAQSADFIERPAEFGTPMTGRVLGRSESARSSASEVWERFTWLATSS